MIELALHPSPVYHPGDMNDIMCSSSQTKKAAHVICLSICACVSIKCQVKRPVFVLFNVADVMSCRSVILSQRPLPFLRRLTFLIGCMFCTAEHHANMSCILYMMSMMFHCKYYISLSFKPEGDMYVHYTHTVEHHAHSV